MRKDDSNYKATCSTRHSGVKHEIEGNQLKNCTYNVLVMYFLNYNNYKDFKIILVSKDPKMTHYYVP